MDKLENDKSLCDWRKENHRDGQWWLGISCQLSHIRSVVVERDFLGNTNFLVVVLGSVASLQHLIAHLGGEATK
jgi:hypothetical protein